jgi:hypothetical protein
MKYWGLLLTNNGYNWQIIAGILHEVSDTFLNLPDIQFFNIIAKNYLCEVF